MQARDEDLPKRLSNSPLDYLHREHPPGPSSNDQHVMAPSSGKQQQRPRGPEAHQTSRVDQPLLCADDLCGHYHPGLSV